MNYKMIKSNYDKGLWTESMVRIARRKGLITEEEMQSILAPDA